MSILGTVITLVLIILTMLCLTAFHWAVRIELEYISQRRRQRQRQDALDSDELRRALMIATGTYLPRETREDDHA